MTNSYLEKFIHKVGITEQQLIDELRDKSTISTFKKGDFLIKNNEYIKVLKIVLTGKVRVYQEHIDREILVYYLTEMETCTLSLSACFNTCKSSVYAIAEEEGVVLSIPVRFVEDWSFKFKSWHRYTIKTFSDSYNILMGNYTALAFSGLKERVLSYILQAATEQNHCTLNMSHQRLANEFGTTRVVISRLLKQLEQDGLLQLGQQEIRLVK